MSWTTTCQDWVVGFIRHHFQSVVSHYRIGVTNETPNLTFEPKLRICLGQAAKGKKKRERSHASLTEQIIQLGGTCQLTFAGVWATFDMSCLQWIVSRGRLTDKAKESREWLMSRQRVFECLSLWSKLLMMIILMATVWLDAKNWKPPMGHANGT